MLDHNEKLKLVIEFIQSGVKDAEKIIRNINKIETNLFKPSTSNNLTKKGQKLKKNGLLNSKNLSKE